MAEELDPATARTVQVQLDGVFTEPIKQRKNGFYPDVSHELAEHMRSGWAKPEARNVAPITQVAETAARRLELSHRFPGEWLVIPAGRLKTRSNDTAYAFRAATEYAYLTGDQSEGGVLVLAPNATGHRATLHLLPRSNRESGEFWLDEQGELWVGPRHSLTEAEQMYGLNTADVRDLPDMLRRSSGPVRIVRGHDAQVEAAVADRTTAHRDEELLVFLSEARLVKDAFEIGELQKAVDSTVRGFEDVVKNLDKAQVTGERYVEGTFFLRARVEGNDVGYGSTCAAGPHTSTLHWARNDGPVVPGDLLLLDAGVETHTLYTADVTRTLPISGRYNAVQRKIYDAVYEAQEAGIAAVRPGARFRDFHDAAQLVLAGKLVEWGVLQGPAERVLELGLQRRWTLHGTGHMLGMDVHDCAAARVESHVAGTLAPGMVFTVEPGLYFQPDDLTVPEEYRGTGVRIEDDILVTEDGSRLLSAGLPRRSDEVEAWMASLRPTPGPRD
ncbi:aminopeptidase P family protein [Streptomyces spinosisporus]|uniref:Xaa-Pro aminopeptidase n=1 Tax=Streptomyces spinosisporus TaxID=2927582 RepID=A0ABS9XSG5_9ACTN|nr:aminopeptidase P family protein [Streptomyces spinosisporus]MCI3245019.1 aminopeptidase P family protein [Streptomyces spinosisporus]